MVFSRILLPHRSTLDHIVGFEIVQQAVGRRMEIQFANKTMSLPDEELRRLLNEGVFVLGVGNGRTYREREINGKKFPSETAIIVHGLRSAGQLAEDEALDRLTVQLGNDNAHGVLTNQPYAVSWILRQAWRLENDPEAWVRRTAHVAHVYLEACRNGKMDLAMREHFQKISAVGLIPKNKRNHQGPMTTMRYMRDMLALGEGEDEILRHAEPFVRVHDRANEKKREAEQKAETGDFETFQMPGHNVRGTWVESDDPYLLSALAYRRHLIVMRNRVGNVIMMSKTFDLTHVGRALTLQEPGLWHLEPMPRNIVANGTEGVEVAATKLSRKAIEYVTGAHIVYKQQ